MNMTNVNVLIKPDETLRDVLAEIYDECGVGPNEPFCFSAIMTQDKQDPDYFHFKANCLEERHLNPYSAKEAVSKLFHQEGSTRYIQPPLDQWLELFKPMLMDIVSSLHPRYEALIPCKDDMISIMYMCVLKLYNKGYYLHKSLVRKSFVNDLNMECRKLKNFQGMESLDATVGEDDDGRPITLLDQLADPVSTEWARQTGHYTEKDYWEDMYQRLKARMLEDMSELQFERILIQLKTNTVDRSTSYQLNKYREIFNPGYTPRPNAKGKHKGKKKEDK